jgi:hypothetical protein
MRLQNNIKEQIEYILMSDFMGKTECRELIEWLKGFKDLNKYNVKTLDSYILQATNKFKILDGSV